MLISKKIVGFKLYKCFNKPRKKVTTLKMFKFFRAYYPTTYTYHKLNSRAHADKHTNTHTHTHIHTHIQIHTRTHGVLSMSLFHVHSIHFIDTRKHPTTHTLAKYTQEPWLYPPAPLTWATEHSSVGPTPCTGTAQVGVSLVSLLDPRMARQDKSSSLHMARASPDRRYSEL